MKKILIVVIALLFVSLQPSQAMWPFSKTKNRQTDEQRHSYDQNAQTFETAVTGEKTPAPNVIVPGTSNVISMNISPNPNYQSHFANATASSDDEDRQDQESTLTKTKLPLSIALVIGGIGLIVLVYAFNYARRASASFNAAYTAVDNYIALHLQHPATTPDQAMVLNQVKAELNKQAP